MSICAIRLDSGLRIALWPRPSAGVVSVSAWLGAGSADETKSGVAHFFEHMLFKGTSRRAVGEIATELESVGGDINAWTTFDNVVVQLRVPPPELDRGIDVIADMLVAPTFEPAEIELEREVIIDELEHASADPQRLLGRALFSTVFRRHPYRLPILGTERSISSIGRQDLINFANRGLAADNLIICVAGDFEVSRARSLIERRFAALPSTARLAPRPTLGSQRAPRERLLMAPVLESQLVLAFPSPPLASREHLLLDMVSIALGQGASSTLAVGLEGDETATSTGAYVHGFRDAGVFVATASAEADRTTACAERLAEMVLATTTDVLDSDRLEMVRNAIISDSVYSRETVGGLAAAMGSAWSFGTNADADRQRVDWARHATAEELREVAAQTLTPERATFAAMLPDASDRPVSGTYASMLARLGKTIHAVPKPAAPKPTKRTKKAPHTRRVELPSGAVLVVHRDDTIPLVAAQATWRGGLRLERSATSGVGALLAATVTQGCGDRSDAEVSRWLDRRAATLSGFSGRNSFGIRAEWIANGDTKALDLLLDCITAPRFDEEVVNRERRRLRDEAESRQSSPSHLAHRMFAEALYGEHPYALDPNGTAVALDRMTEYADRVVRRHFEDHYPVSALTLAIVGDVDPDATIAAVKKRLAAMPRSNAATVKVKAGALSKDRERYAYLEQGRAHLVVGFRGASLNDSDRTSLEVVAAVLGGQGGRLFAALREKRGLVYRVAAHSVEGIEPGAFAVVTACRPSNVKETLEIIRAEIERLGSGLVSEEELKRAVTYLAGARAHSLERRGNLAAALAYAEAHGLGYASVFDTRADFEKLTPSDIQRVAARFLRWDQAVTSTVLPPKATPAVLKRSRGVRRKLPAAAARKRRR